VAKWSVLEHWPLYVVLTLLLGEMLDVVICGPHRGKLRLLCQGWYVWSTWTKQNLRFDHHFNRNSNPNRISWIDCLCVFHVRSLQCVETNITRRPFCQRITYLYLSKMRLPLWFTTMYPGEQTTNIGLTYCTSQDHGNPLQPAAKRSWLDVEYNVQVGCHSLHFN